MEMGNLSIGCCCLGMLLVAAIEEFDGPAFSDRTPPEVLIFNDPDPLAEVAEVTAALPRAVLLAAIKLPIRRLPDPFATDAPMLLRLSIRVG